MNADQQRETNASEAAVAHFQAQSAYWRERALKAERELEAFRCGGRKTENDGD
jgi:hypothetical protein